MTRRRRPGFTPGVSPLRSGSFRRVLRTQAPRRGGCRARYPGDRPPAVPAVSRCRARQHHGQAVTLALGALEAVKMSQRPGRNAAHCPGWPLQPQRCFASRCAGRAFGTLLTLETSASPAGLTARARPEARPETRAARPPGSYQGGRGKADSYGHAHRRCLRRTQKQLVILTCAGLNLAVRHHDNAGRRRAPVNAIGSCQTGRAQAAGALQPILR